MADNVTPPAAQRMFGMITGYWVSQTIGTVAALGIVDAIQAGEHRLEQLAPRLGCHQESLGRLLRTGATIGLFTHSDGEWNVTELAETLGANHPGSMRGMALAQTSPAHWLPWMNLTAAVRTGQPQTKAAHGQDFFEYYADPRHQQEALAFNQAMHAMSSLAARELAACLELAPTSRIVDVGGAQGTLLRSLLAKWPNASGVLLDLPHIASAMSVEKVAWPEGERVDVSGGDFFDRVPEADVYVLKQVLHDWSDAQCITLLENCAQAMRTHGRVVIVECIIPDDGQPSPATLMDLNMLVLLPGRERTRAEYAGLLGAVGLVVERISPTSTPFSIIEAVRAT